MKQTMKQEIYAQLKWKT